MAPKDMWKEMVTPKTVNDIADFWKKYREDNGIGKNIILLVMDIDRSLSLELGRVMNLFIDAVMDQREYSGKSALQPKVDADADYCSCCGKSLKDDDDVLFVIRKGEVDAIHWSHGDIYLAEMHEDE